MRRCVSLLYTGQLLVNGYVDLILMSPDWNVSILIREITTAAHCIQRHLVSTSSFSCPCPCGGIRKNQTLISSEAESRDLVTVLALSIFGMTRSLHESGCMGTGCIWNRLITKKNGKAKKACKIIRNNRDHLNRSVND